MVYLAELRRLSSGVVYDPDGEPYYEELLRRLNVTYRVSGGSTDRIPREGPAVIAANHPFGLIDGIVAGSLVSGVRRDVRLMANSLLLGAEGIAGSIIPVNPFGGAERQNAKGLREALQWLRDGHALIVFPAGEVAAWKLTQGYVAEPEWNEIVARLVRKTKSTVTPLFFHGTNSPMFHAVGMVHPKLRTLLLPRELFNKRGRNLDVSVGTPIPASSLDAYPSDREAIDYLRWRTQVLGARPAKLPPPPFALPPLPFAQPNKTHEPIAEPEDPAVCRAEIEALPPLVEQSGYSVHLAEASQIPHALRELGRLREISFREAGEGSGNARDLDLFDQHYRHVILWNREQGEIVGGYRLACTDEVIRRYGKPGLYTSTLFRYKPGFLESVTPAIELGRSFVRTEYQRNFAPLLLLWKGIGRFVADHPWYKVMFGPVSISNDYSPLSKDLMISFLRTHCGNSELAASVAPKKPYHRHGIKGLKPVATIDHLSEVISDLEPDRKGLPVLIRQYLNLGGEIVAFNRDKSFSDCVDGLIVVDLRKTQHRLLEKYLGKDGAERFRELHAAKAAA